MENNHKTMISKQVKTIFVVLIGSLLLLQSFTGLKSKKFKVEILQNGRAIEIVDNVVQLEKKEFKIRVTLKKQDGVFMSASFHRDYFDLEKDDAIKDYKWLNQKAFAEESFNQDKALMVDNEGVSYLFYDKEKDWHRFDKGVKVKGKKVIGTKTIRQVLIPNTNEKIDLWYLNKDIYLFFVATEDWENGDTPKELGRLKVRIQWK